MFVDSGLLQQALLNLCINAHDAMPNGGHLILRTQNVVLSAGFCEAYPEAHPGPHALIAVADNGSGMSPEVRERIFEPFFTTKEPGKGTGLGLAMVYGMVEQHGGMIHLYSEPGCGTTFKIYLPISERNLQHPSPAAVPPSSGGSETILIAEDDPFVRHFVVRVLQGAGYKTISAADGEEGRRVFVDNQDNIALALLDIVMPCTGGRVLGQQLRSIRPDIRVIFCTGHDSEIAQEESDVSDMFRILQKPVDPVELLQAVRSELDEYKSVGESKTNKVFEPVNNVRRLTAM